MRQIGDRVVAVTAGVIGVAALLISAWQAYIMREQQRVSVWPRVEILVNNGGQAFNVTLSNAGIGPALVQHAEVLLDGTPRRSWSDILTALDASGGVKQGRIADRILTPTQVQEILAPQEQAGIDALNAAAARLELRVCYCSIYDECWSVARTLQGGARVRYTEVKRCEIDEERRFSL